MPRARIFMSYLRLCLLLIAVVAVFACKGEPKTADRKNVTATNPYSHESVFDELKKKTDNNPGDADALFHLGELYERNSQYAEAIEAYKKVVKLNPSSGLNMGYLHFKIGTALDRTDKAAEAIEEFSRAVKQLPSYPVLYNNMGVAYGKLGRLDDEITLLKKAIRLRPSYSSARYNLGLTYLKKKNLKGAMSEYEALKEIDEGAASALLKEIRAGS